MPRVTSSSLVKWHGSPLSPLHLLTAYPTFTSISKGFGTVADSKNPCMRMIVKKIGGDSSFESKHLPADHICWMDRTSIRIEVQHRKHGSDPMDIRLRPGYKHAAQETPHKALEPHCRIQIIVGRKNFDIFQQTEAFQKGHKFSFKGGPRIFGQSYHGCIVLDTQKTFRRLLWGVWHTEAFFHSAPTDMARLTDTIYNTAMALSGLAMSGNKGYFEWRHSPEFRSKNPLLTAIDIVCTEKTTGQQLSLLDLPPIIHNWLARNADFQLSEEADSVAQQILLEMSARGHKTQREAGYPSLQKGMGNQ